MATSSWRLEDLHQLEELGLAGQLESTRLQETGAGLHSAEPDLTCVPVYYGGSLYDAADTGLFSRIC